MSENTDNARLLLRYGATPKMTDSFGNTPLHLAVTKGNFKLVKMLEEFGADALAKNQDQMCPIDISIVEDKKDIKMYFMRSSKYSNFDFSGNSGH